MTAAKLQSLNPRCHAETASKSQRLKHRRIKMAQEEYPGIVHFLRIEQPGDLDDDLTGWLQEAYDHRKRKAQGEDEG